MTPSASAAVARAPRPFVGRHEQLAWLQERVEEARNGRPQIVLLSGEPGIGKTRLTQQLSSLPGADGMQFSSGRCYEEFALPYQPFAPTIARAFAQDTQRISDRLGDDIHSLEILLDSSSTQIASAPAAPSEQQRLFNAVALTLITLAQTQPTAIVLDDLHWADTSTLELLKHVVLTLAHRATLEDIPLLIVATHRPVDEHTPLHRTLLAIEPEPICSSLQLGGFDDAELTLLVQSLHLGAPAPRLVEMLATATHGNPLFIREAVQTLEMQGSLQTRAGELTTATRGSDLHFPTHVAAAIRARLQGLSSRCLALLTRASLLWHGFTLPVLAAVAGETEERIEEWLDEAVDLGFVARDGGTFQFAHPLVQQVCRGEVSTGQRQTMHNQIARSLMDVHAEQLQDHVLEIAQHLLAAGPAAAASEVVHYAERAGARALQVFAWAESARYYEAVLQAHDQLATNEDAELGRLHVLLGGAHYRDMNADAALAHYDKGITHFSRSSRAHELGEVLKEKLRTELTQTTLGYGTEVDLAPLEQVLHSLDPQDVSLRGQILAVLAQAYWVARQPDRAEVCARQALEISDEIGDDRLCADTATGLALAQLQHLRVHEALETWRYGLTRARRTGDAWVQGWPASRIPLALIWLGQVENADAAVVDALAVTAQTMDWAEHSLALGNRVCIDTLRGDFLAAEDDAREAMAAARRSHYPWGGFLFLPALAAVRTASGLFDAADDAIEMLVEPGQLLREPNATAQFMAWVYHQLIQLQRNGLADAERETLVETLSRTAQSQDNDINLLMVAAACIEVAGTQQATHLDGPLRTLKAAHEHGIVLTAGWPFLIPRMLGLGAARQGDRDAAVLYFETAIESGNRLGLRLEMARTCLDYAELLATSKVAAERNRGVSLAEQAARLFASLGMNGFAPRWQLLGQTLGIDLLASVPPSHRHAAHIEGHLLALLRLGRGQASIADELLLRAATLATMEQAAIERLGVATRSEVLAQAAALPSKPYASQRAQPRTFRPLPAVQPIVILFTHVDDAAGDGMAAGASAAIVLRDHDAIIRSTLAEHGGIEIKHTGEGINAWFPSAVGAIASTVSIQKRLRARNRDCPTSQVQVRIGLNAGTPIHEGGQLYGLSVNAAARICACARPGQILVSEIVRQLADSASEQFVDQGMVRLKGFERPVRLYEVTCEAAA